MRATAWAFLAVIAAIGTWAAQAAEVTVSMANRGPDHAMQFDPELVRIAPGDSVHFVAVDKGHNAESIPGMIPDGAQRFTGVMGQDLTVTFTVPGVYGYRCAPHSGSGMVGLIVVGTPTNEETAKRVNVPPPARRTFQALFARLDQSLAKTVEPRSLANLGR